MKLLVYIYFFAMLEFVDNQASTRVTTVDKLKEAAVQFSKLLAYHTNKMTNYMAITEKLANLSKNVKFKKRDGQNLSDTFKASVEQLFAKKEKLLVNLKENITVLKNTSTYDPFIETFYYPNSRSLKDLYNDINVSFVKIVKEFPTDVPINQTRSFVHIPTNVNGKNKKILNVVKWTENLDKVFQDNQKNDKSVILQYYCDSSGLFRMFPGNLNGLNETNVDLYDCRRRLWYQQSASSPKDIVVVIDRSGSMTGDNFDIAKLLTKSLIDTLVENDYFNVITVSKTAAFLDRKVPFLIQATKFNKERMKWLINKIESPSNVLQLSEGINMAFNVLNSKANYNRTFTANCNKIVIVVSDGIEGNYKDAAEDVFNKINADKSVRVFSFLVGRVKNPDDRALKEMSCNNRGYFYNVETIGNVWDIVVEYINVLSRPIANYKGNLKAQLSPVYLDSTGAGKILTMSLAVLQNNQISGVVGVDMLIRALNNEVPVSDLGYFSHSIIINNNGFIILHPKVKDQSGYLPTPPNVYFEDLEYSVNNDSKTLKEKMIRGENGSMTFTTYWLYANDSKVVENKMTYYFNSINNTVLSSTIALSEVDLTYVEFNWTMNVDLIKKGIEALYVPPIPENSTDTPVYTYVQIPQWTFCENASADTSSITEDVKAFPTASELQAYLANISDVENLIESCDEDRITNLLVSAGLVFETINKSWEIYQAEKSFEDPDYISLFVGTNGGYTRYFSLNNTGSPDRDSLRISLFEQAIAFPNVNIIVSVPFQAKLISNKYVYVQVKASSWMEQNGEKVLMAVTGTEMISDLLYDMLDNVTKSISLECKDNRTVTCAVLDENGYIVVSNLGVLAIGKFFGQYQGGLMKFLTEKSIFRTVNLDDTQASCEEAKTYVSAANTLIKPAKFVFKFFAWLLHSIWSMLYSTVMIIVLLLKNHKADAQVIEMINVSCVNSLSFFLFQSTKWNEFYDQELEMLKKNKRATSNLRVDCGNKNQFFYLADIPDTNLIFIVVEIPDGCKPTSMGLDQKKNIETEFYLQEESFRKDPGYCFNESTVAEEASELCGAGNELSASFMITLILLSFLLFLFLFDK